MKPKDLLQLAVRLLGLVFLYHGLQALPMAVIQFFTAYLHAGSLLTSLMVTGWPLLLAYWLLRGAPLLMRIAHPEAPETT